MFRAVLSHAGPQVLMSAGKNALRRSNSGSVSSQIVSPLACKLKDIRKNTHTNLKLQLQKSLPPVKFEQTQELTEQIETEEPDFDQLHAQMAEFVQTHKNDPEAIVGALKYLNSQLMILSAAERQIKAENAPIDQWLVQGLKSLIDHSSNQGESIVQTLSNTKISPVFTAHPTNFNKPEASAIVLSQLDDIASPHGNAKVCQELWETQGVRNLKPTVQDEARQFSSNIRHLHSSGRTIHKYINQQLSVLPDQLKLSKPLVEAGNWVGGDRDGNPNIDAKVLKDVVRTLSAAAFEYFEKKIGQEKNTQAGSLCNLLCKSGHSESLTLIRQKLARTRTHLVGNSPLPIQGDLYLNANELVHDLESLSIASLNTQEKAAVQEQLDLLKLDADSIGFHGASTDIRQNSAMNEKTVGELLRRSGGPSNYESLGEVEKQTLLTSLLLGNSALVLSDVPIDGQGNNPEFEREIGLIKSYKTIHDTYGPQALKNCITANTETMSDMLEVMLLLKYAGLADEHGIKMNVVPLIETVRDLHNGPDILNSMLNHPWYRQALKSSGNQQQIMVGYSDSNRLDGPLASSWAVYEGTAKMQEVANQNKINLHVFHGRGGTEARGSGDSYAQEIRSSNGASLVTGMRQTEQGEEVPAKFGTETMSKSNLADMVGSTLETMSKGTDQGLVKYTSTMEKLAQHARESYANLYSDPELPRFFQSSTPIEFVGKSNAGSRPASRASDTGGQLNLDKLRAIPWVGSWYQSGSAMPAYFGTGSAIKQFIEQPTGTTTPLERTTQLQTMYKEWPFFKTLIDRTATAMEKADMTIAQGYAKLAPAQSQGVFEKIKNEYELTKEMILNIKQSNNLMDHNPVDAEILAVKKPLTQAAHAMQIGLLKAHQQAGPEIRDKLVEPIVMSMQAIASSNRFG